MKKIALLLAALLMLGMLAACNSEKEKEPAHVIGGYQINIYEDGWKEVEDTGYDMELIKDGVTMAMIGFTKMDFVDVPSAEDLYVDANEDLLEDKSVVVTKEAETSYEKNGNKYISTLFSAKDGEKDMQYYCFMVSFDDEAGSMAWISFSATPEVMKQEKASLKKMVEAMDANGEYLTPEELEQQVQDALEQENGVEEEAYTDGEAPAYEDPMNTEPEETVEIGEATAPALEETAPALEETEPALEETEPAGENAEDETVPATEAPVTEGETTPAAEGTETDGESTDATVEVETTPAAEATEAATGATE